MKYPSAAFTTAWNSTNATVGAASRNSVGRIGPSSRSRVRSERAASRCGGSWRRFEDGSVHVRPPVLSVQCRDQRRS